MPKITKAGGPSYEGDITPPPGFTGDWGDGEQEHSGTGGEDVEFEAADDGGGDPGEHNAEKLPRPAANAPKADWLAYARQVTGEDLDDADYTKAELVDLVGKD